MNFNTYLFDFDGTLVDSMPSYIAAMLRILDENNIKDSIQNRNCRPKNIFFFISLFLLKQTPWLYSQSCLIIWPIFALNLPYISFRRYFGINTIWYLQFHQVCDKLESSLVFFAIDITSLLFVFGCQTYAHYTTEVFIFNNARSYF